MPKPAPWGPKSESKMDFSTHMQLVRDYCDSKSYHSGFKRWSTLKMCMDPIYKDVLQNILDVQITARREHPILNAEGQVIPEPPAHTQPETPEWNEYWDTVYLMAFNTTELTMSALFGAGTKDQAVSELQTLKQTGDVRTFALEINRKVQLAMPPPARIETDTDEQYQTLLTQHKGAVEQKKIDTLLKGVRTATMRKSLEMALKKNSRLTFDQLVMLASQMEGVVDQPHGGAAAAALVVNPLQTLYSADSILNDLFSELRFLTTEFDKHEQFACKLDLSLTTDEIGAIRELLEFLTGVITVLKQIRRHNRIQNSDFFFGCLPEDIDPTLLEDFDGRLTAVGKLLAHLYNADRNPAWTYKQMVRFLRSQPRETDIKSLKEGMLLLLEQLAVAPATVGNYQLIQLQPVICFLRDLSHYVSREETLLMRSGVTSRLTAVEKDEKEYLAGTVPVPPPASSTPVMLPVAAPSSTASMMEVADDLKSELKALLQPLQALRTPPV